jgi:OmpA-OmpF porin, OOP family
MKKYLFLSLLFIGSITVFAQSNKKFIIISGGGGIQSLRYNTEGENSKMGAGGLINASFQYFFRENWGIAVGMGIQTNKSKATVNFTLSQNAVDADGDNCEYRTYFSEWKEKQNAIFLEIPISGIYRYSINRKIDLLGTLGIKIAVPLYAKYKVTSGRLTTTGYYKQWNVELSDMPQHDFSTITEKYNSDVTLKKLLALDMEIGSLYKMNKNMQLYFGIYFNYGLNNSINKSNNPVYQYDGTYNGILNSEITNKVNLLAIGIKVGLRLDADKWFKLSNKKFHSRI